MASLGSLAWRGSAGLAVLLFAMFFDVLFAPGNRVLGSLGTDLATQFLFWRDFGFRELANGHIALWNPHIFAGAPYFGGMQAALLYPPNWLFLVLPLVPAVNWTIVVNAWLLGTFAFLWAMRRGLHPLAAFTAAALLTFCTPHFLHIYAGHLTNLATMAWAPLLFLAIDEWFRSRKFGWCLLGMLAVAMQLLAGHPQYVFYTAIAAGGYSLVRLATEDGGGRLRTAAGLLSIHPGGALLAAAQLVAGLQATQETIRGRRLPFQFVAEFDFPPENFLTSVAPGFFGNVQFYWGKGHLWEASLFIGVVGLALALYGMRKGQTPGKLALLWTIAMTLVLALGDNTPLLRLLYEYVPGFDRFRATAKFVFLTALPLVLFAGIGLDRILRSQALEARMIWAAGAAALALCLAALAVHLVDWQLVMLSLWSSGKVMRSLSMYGNPALVAQSQEFASLSLWIAGITLAVAAGVAAWLRAEPRRMALWLGCLAVAEVFFVARVNRDSFEFSQVTVPYFGDAARRGADPYRILNPSNPNAAMSTGQFEVWGDDPGVTPRYAEFIAWSQGLNPERATQFIRFRNSHPLLKMVRLRYATKWADYRTVVFEVAEPPMTRLALLGSYRVIGDRDAIFRAMGAEAFDPRREVILEKEPEPRPQAAHSPGNAEIVREGTDFLEIDAVVGTPCILLVTDAWAPSWRATALTGSSQQRYEVMPANYALRGIPLGAGKHRLRLEYAPSAYAMGWWISATAWLAWFACWVPAWRGLHPAPEGRHA